MANLKSNVSVTKVKNLLVIDPNAGTNNSVNTEDLSISVELEVFERGDEPIIYTNNNGSVTNETPLEATRISFIDGAGEEESYLTTNYTELNTNFSSNNDLGTLGIETIDISFNTSYTPIVKIKFKDIRAKLFELGDESPYAFMFRMPYPIFYLTVKGYYGKPVKYALHMTKFNGELDNDSGSFIITCDFIGYTYAFLADILMGLLKGVPYTAEGMNLIENIDDFTTFEELTNIIRKLEAKILKYRNDNKKLKALTLFDDFNTRLEKIEASLTSDLSNLFKEYKILNDANVNSGKFFAMTLESNKLDDDEIDEYETGTLGLVNDYIEFNKITSNGESYSLNIEDFQLDSDGIQYSNFIPQDFLKKGELVENEDGTFTQLNETKSFEEFQLDKTKLNKYKNFKSVGDSEENSFKSKMYYDTINIMNNKLKPNQNSNIYYTNGRNIIDIRFALEKINIVKEKIRDDFNEKKKEVTKDFTETISQFLITEGGNFDASIGSLFKILCNHVDLFVNVLKKVEGKIKDDMDSGNRNLPVSDKENFTEYVDTDGSTEISVRPFPEYITKEDSTDGSDDDDRGIVEKWLGSDSKFNDYQEVIFINDLYASMMKAAKKDKENIENINAPKKGWYPVNPLESLAFNATNVNPWSVVSDSNIEPVIQLMLQRMTLFLGYSYNNLKLSDIKNMAKIEANQAYSAIINPNTRNGIMPIGSSDEKYSEQIDKFIGVDRVTDFGKMGKNHGQRLYFNNSSWYEFWEPNDGAGTYTYHHTGKEEDATSVEDALIQRPEYIPITQNEAFLKSNDKRNTLNNAETRSSTSTTFVSNITSNTEAVEGTPNGEEFETFIKIIDDSEYKNVLKYDEYGTGKNTRITKPIGTGLASDNNDLLGGIYKTHEFTTYGKTPLYYEFYDKLLKEDLILRNEGKKKDFTFQPKFISYKKDYNLFGSKFYYSQTDIGRAFLFLHTIPFDGLISEVKNAINGERTILSKKTIKFFDERAGFVSVPKSWILFMGGLLYRDSLENDMITFTDVGGTSLIPNVDEVLANKDDLLIHTINAAGDTISEFSDGPMNFGRKENNRATNSVKYVELSNVIKKLPQSVKEIFIYQFINWVDSDEWFELKSELEVFKSDITPLEVTTFWDSFTDNTQDVSLLNPSFDDNYEPIIRNTTFHSVFDVTIKEDSGIANELNDFLIDKKMIINGTYRIWRGSDDRYVNFNFPLNNAKEYLKTFFNTFKDLNTGQTIDPDSEIKKTLFNTDNVDDIKLSLYKNVKSIYNKWIIGVHPNMCSVIINDLYNSFNFIDRAYIDISDKFKISPTGFIDYLSNNSNISFYNFIARILRDNNFDFIPLPTFIDYSDESDVKSIFEPVRFNKPITGKGPLFICMYFGEQSNKLNIDKKKKTKNNDSFGLATKYDKNGDLIITDFSELPKDFKSGNKNIPYFLVNYADQNQSMFKKINLNQNEFTETNESLEIIESISNMNRNNSIGQNLFDVYNNRAYSAEVEMLGCAQIQPFMFFQVNNVPIFDGAYTIINTRHHIKPNHMTTTFKGVRIRRIKTKMVDDETLYAHLISNLNEVDSEGANISDLDVSFDDRVIMDNASLGIPDAVKGKFNNPLAVMNVSSDFGPRAGFERPHKGIDFSAEVGTKCVAVEDLIINRIRYTSSKPTGGLYVDFKVVDKNGYGELYVRYMHLSKLTHPAFEGFVPPTSNYDSNITSNTAIGKYIKKGVEIGETGVSGTNTPHLHLDIRNKIGDVRDITLYKEPQWFFDKVGWTFNPNQVNLDTI